MLKRDVLRKEISVHHSESRWSSYDGTRLYSQTWQPESASPRAVINLVHGLGDHSGRYSIWAQLFVEAGYIVRSYDHRGHGKSEGKRGYSAGMNRLIKDLDLFISAGREEFPGLTVFNYGHSMGGNLVLNHTIQQLTPVNGLIVTSPWLELRNPPSPLMVFASSLVGNLIPGIVAGNRLRAEDISRDLRIVHLYKTDPLVHGKIGMKLFSQLYEAGIKASMSIYKINCPLLVMHGEADNITSCKATRNFVRNASSKTTYIEWEGCYHELHNDLQQEQVFDSIRTWLDRLTTSQS